MTIELTPWTVGWTGVFLFALAFFIETVAVRYDIYKNPLRACNLITGYGSVPVVICCMVCGIIVACNESHAQTYPGKWAQLYEFMDNHSKEIEKIGIKDFHDNHGCPTPLTQAAYNGLARLTRWDFTMFQECVPKPTFAWNDESETPVQSVDDSGTALAQSE